MEVVKENQQLHMVSMVYVNTITPNHNIHIEFRPCQQRIVFSCHRAGDVLS